MRVVLHVNKIFTVISAVSVSTVSESFEFDLKTRIVTGWVRSKLSEGQKN